MPFLRAIQDGLLLPLARPQGAVAGQGSFCHRRMMQVMDFSSPDLKSHARRGAVIMTKQRLWDLIMRFSPAAITLSICLAVMSSAGQSKRADYEIDPRSTAMVKRGDAALKAGERQSAAGFYETALAVDPRNRNAYVALARLMNRLNLKGKAIRYYGEALEIDPNNLTTLAEQSDVMVTKGAVTAAKKNLARMRILCRSKCDKLDKLAAAIASAQDEPSLQASAVEISPTADRTEETAKKQVGE